MRYAVYSKTETEPYFAPLAVTSDLSYDADDRWAGERGTEPHVYAVAAIRDDGVQGPLGDGVWNDDADHDGLPDYEEMDLGTDPYNPDTDADGLTDGQERLAGTDPRAVDTDQDGFSDAIEVRVGTDPLDSASVPAELTVTRAGAGAGRVVSDLPGIDCGAACSAYYKPHAVVTLTAEAGFGAYLYGWDGACSGKAPTCTVTMDGATVVSAGFEADTTPPVISGLPADLVVEAATPSGAAVTYDLPTAYDTVSGVVPVVCLPGTGATFPLGSTQVQCTAGDAAGNTATASFSVIVQDTTPPAFISVPGDLAVEATGPDGAMLNYASPAASDLVSGSVAVTCLPASGATFALGINQVECTASDAAGNTAMASFNVIVRDTTPPVLSLPTSAVVEASGPGGSVFNFTASAQDSVDGPVPVVCSPPSGSIFVLGLTTVHCSANDVHGNKVTGSFSVSVVDTTPPSISCPAPAKVDASGPSGATVSFTPLASDSLPGVSASCVPPSGSLFRIGTTTVLCTAKDASSNTAHCSFTVTVDAPRAVMESVLSDLNALRGTVSDKLDGNKLDDAIDHLAKAVEDRVWRDASHPDEKKGDKAFDEAKEAAKKLLELVKDKHTTLSDATLQGFAGRLAGAGRVTAQIAVVEAVARGGEPKKIDKAREEITKGDAENAKSKPGDALDHFGKAWRAALEA